MLKKVVAVKLFSVEASKRPTARDIRATIMRHLFTLVSTGNLDQSALKGVGLNLHIYRTIGKGVKVVDLRGTDGVVTEGAADRITIYLKRSLKEADVDVAFYFTENVIERLRDFEYLKRQAIDELQKYREIDYVDELLGVLENAEDMAVTGTRKDLQRQGMISLDYMSEVVNRLQRHIRKTHGKRDTNITQVKRRIQKIRGKMISPNTPPHYLNYPYSGPRGLKEKIDMFTRENVGFYLRVAARIPRSEEIMVISVNPWRGACNAFKEAERNETIDLFKLFVSLIAREWKFSRLRIENIPVGDINKFEKDDVLSIILGFLRKNLTDRDLRGTTGEVVRKIEKIQGWGPVWSLDEIMIVIAMIYGEAPSPKQLLDLLGSTEFRESGIKIYGDQEDGYFIYLRGIDDGRRDSGIITAANRREHIDLGDFQALIKR